jgi:hypothetical protein
VVKGARYFDQNVERLTILDGGGWVGVAMRNGTAEWMREKAEGTAFKG